MSDAVLFALLSFTSYRIWRLVGRDEITEPVRNKLGNGWVHTMVACPWCLGSWVSFALVYSWHRWVNPLEPRWGLWAFAVACVVGLLGEFDE